MGNAVVRGRHFDLWAGKVIYGFDSPDNIRPTTNIDWALTSEHAFQVVEMTDTEIVLQCVVTHVTGTPRYLGCLAEVDGSSRTVLWANDSQPLP